jgi:paraquat-inducible protein B
MNDHVDDSIDRDHPPDTATSLRPRVVGIFVLTAVALALIGIAAISSGRLLTEQRTYVTYLPQATAGLKEGSPVTLRQVPVGQVKDVELVFGKGYQDSRIMVVFRMKRGAVKNVEGQSNAFDLSDAELAKTLIAAGLRAAVHSSSPVAGQKSIDLDFHPDLEPRFYNVPSSYPEIPTAPTGMELLSERIEGSLEKLSRVPVDEVLLQLKSTLASVERTSESKDVKGALRELRLTLAEANRTLTAAEKTIDSVGGTVTGAVQDTRATLTSVNGTVKDLGGNLSRTLDRLDRTLASIDRNIERTAERTTDVQAEAAKTLDEMNELLKSLRSLIDTLQRHPESLLRGKPQPEAKK